VRYWVLYGRLGVHSPISPSKNKKAVSDLKSNPSVMILPADKGRATVVLDKAKYEEKILRMLLDEKTYKQLEKDPTASYKRKLVAILTRLKDEGKLSDNFYYRLYPMSEKIPQLYCLPKIHKNVPFRPIVNYTVSIGYNTSRFLADILYPLIGQSEQFVKNSRQLAEELSSVQIED